MSQQIELERPPAARTATPTVVRRALSPAHIALVGILALSAVLDTYRLDRNGWANTFYSAGVKSMLGSLHDFFFVSFDPGGLVTIDKPPLGVWLQVLSAKLFGFAPLSLLLPEAILGTLTVALLYVVLVRRLGQLSALAAALARAVFPIFVAVSRDNGVDPLLIALMLLACACALRALERGRIAWLLCSAALIGLAFNTKTLAAYLVVPGIALGWLVCAPVSLVRRALALAAFMALVGVVSFAWIAAVELTPASQRPYVGSSTDNTEIGLTFEYNGFGRVEGEVGGPGKILVRGGGLVPAAPHPRRSTRRVTAKKPREGSKYLPDGRYRYPIAFGGNVGPLRLFDSELDGQAAWLLPLALFGTLAFALWLLPPRRGHPAGRRRRRARAETIGPAGSAAAAPERTPAPTSWSAARRDPRAAVLLVLGGWFAVEYVVLSWSKGIVHPYYLSALAPGAAAMIGGGIGAFADFARARDLRLLLLAAAVLATVITQVRIIDEQSYLQWFVPFLAGLAGLVTVALLVRRAAVPAVVLLLLVLLIAPAAYAATTWLAPGEGTFPAAGPHEAIGVGRFDLEPKVMEETRNLVAYAATHRAARRWSLLTDSAPTAAPMILLGSRAGALGGYGGSDPVLDGRGLARMIARGQARYVVIGGEYAERGGNKATAATIRDCPQVPHEAWHGPPPGPSVLVLFDCAGRERALEAHPAG